MLHKIITITCVLVALISQLQAFPFLHNSNLRPSKLIKMPEFEQPIYFDDTQSFNESDSNEATPGFLQKQLDKIVAKLQYFTSLTRNTDERGDDSAGVVITTETSVSGVDSGIANVTETFKKSEYIQKIENPKKTENQKVEKMESSIAEQILSPVVSLAFRIFSAAGGGQPNN